MEVPQQREREVSTQRLIFFEVIPSGPLETVQVNCRKSKERSELTIQWKAERVTILETLTEFGGKVVFREIRFIDLPLKYPTVEEVLTRLAGPPIKCVDFGCSVDLEWAFAFIDKVTGLIRIKFSSKSMFFYSKSGQPSQRTYQIANRSISEFTLFVDISHYLNLPEYDRIRVDCNVYNLLGSMGQTSIRLQKLTLNIQLTSKIVSFVDDFLNKYPLIQKSGVLTKDHPANALKFVMYKSVKKTYSSNNVRGACEIEEVTLSDDDDIDNTVKTPSPEIDHSSPMDQQSPASDNQNLQSPIHNSVPVQISPAKSTALPSRILVQPSAHVQKPIAHPPTNLSRPSDQPSALTQKPPAVQPTNLPRLQHSAPTQKPPVQSNNRPSSIPPSTLPIPTLMPNSSSNRAYPATTPTSGFSAMQRSYGAPIPPQIGPISNPEDLEQIRYQRNTHELRDQERRKRELPQYDNDPRNFRQTRSWSNNTPARRYGKNYPEKRAR